MVFGYASGLVINIDKCYLKLSISRALTITTAMSQV